VERSIAVDRSYLLAGEAGDAGGVADLLVSPPLVVPPAVPPGVAVVVSPARRSQLASDKVATRTAAAYAVLLRVLMTGSLEKL
jgi:hypothetical protein